MKHIAPPHIGPLEFEGISNELILVELDADADGHDLLRSALAGKLILIFSPNIDIHLDKKDGDYEYAVMVQADSVYKIFNYLRYMQAKLDYIVVDRIDMMDIELTPKERGAQQNAFIGMLSAPKNLRGCNIIVTSSFQEETIKKKSSRFLNLKTTN